MPTSSRPCSTTSSPKVGRGGRGGGGGVGLVGGGVRLGEDLELDANQLKAMLNNEFAKGRAGGRGGRSGASVVGRSGVD